MGLPNTGSLLVNLFVCTKPVKMQSALRKMLSTRVTRHALAIQRLTAVRCMATAPPSNHYILQYSYVPDILEKRTPYREAHIAAAQVKRDAGKIILGGAFGSPPEGALFVWKNATEEEIKAFVEADPYVCNGLVPAWSLKPYTVVIS